MGPKGGDSKSAKEVLDIIREVKKFDSVRQDKQKQDDVRHKGKADRKL